MFTLTVGICCDFPGCGVVHVVTRASPVPALTEDDTQPPRGWVLIQKMGGEGALIYCPRHDLRLDGQDIKRRAIGFATPQLEPAPAEESA